MDAQEKIEVFKADLLATVSHELRSPLTSIKGYAATLLRYERRITREERREFLQAINEASDRLELIVDRLLMMSQLEAGAIEMSRTPVSLVFLVQEAVFAARLIALQYRQGMRDEEGRPFTFALRVEDEHGRCAAREPVILADRIYLREVFDNVLENAMHYMPKGGPIEIVIRPLRSPGEEKQTALRRAEVEIVVRDRGIGIAREQLQAIFERFHRVDTRLTREVNGLGLGLAICKHIVELHHGTIWAQSVLDQGSDFHIVLPMEGEGGTTEQYSTVKDR